MPIPDLRVLVAALAAGAAMLASGTGATATPPVPTLGSQGATERPRVAPTDPGRALADRRARLRRAESFALAIGSGQLDGVPSQAAARLGAYDIVVVDAQEATRAQVRALQARGTVVLGYLSVGTIERGRPWTRAARRYRLERWERWDEWYAKVSAAGYRTLVAGRIAPGVLGRGFDGLFLDNVDMIEEHPRQARGMATLVTRLAALAHGRGRLLAAQNGGRRVRPLLDRLDLWNREDVTSTWSPDRRRYVIRSHAERRRAVAALREARRRGLVTTVTDYAPPGDRSAQRRTASAACPIGALPFTSDIDPERTPRAPLTCGRE